MLPLPLSIFYSHFSLSSSSPSKQRNGAFSFTLFTITGDIGKEWNVARVPIDLSEDFQLVFSASVGDGNLGDIALDDILLSQGSCPPVGKLLVYKPGGVLQRLRST